MIEASDEVRRFVARAVEAYAASSVLSDVEYGGGPEVRLLASGTVDGDVPPADLVVSFDPPSRMGRCDERLLRLGKLARKVLVVLVPNPERPWPLRPGRRSSTTELAGVLWKVGRVRERAYLGVPRSVAGPDVEPSVAHAGFLVRHTARLQAFVVDTRPRTPQARRRLRVGGSP